jgi:16S rRNA (guanine527-N7)-methyltransferase
VEDVWHRHILDCSQLLEFLTEEEIEKGKCVDLGAGAGLPGIVLSILGVKHMVLIEKSPLKCKFLREAAKISENMVEIVNENVYEVRNVTYDMVFSRALANLSELLAMVNSIFKKKTKCIFLKGKKTTEEIEEAQKHFHFKYELHDSKTSEEGKVVIITKLMDLLFV